MNENCSAGLGDEPTGSEVNQITQTLLRLYEVGIEFINQGQLKSTFPLHHSCLVDVTDDCPYSPASLVFFQLWNIIFFYLYKEIQGTLYSGQRYQRQKHLFASKKSSPFGMK